MGLIMDSGAFSAWSKGKNIDFEKYIEYLHLYEDQIDLIVNLDVIPASPGVKKIPKEVIENSARKGFRNYRRLIREGFSKEKVIHVFHQNEDFKWLQLMVEKIPYIGLSPANDRTTKEKIRWLDNCMKYVLDSDGFPKVKFHGFAVTSHELMRRYPWYSVDSSSWCIQAGLGDIYVPPLTKNGWDFSVPPRQIKTSQLIVVPDTLKKYLDELGLKLGKSEFKKVDENYQLQQNERFVGKGLAKDKRIVEVLIESGIINSHQDRYLVNAHYIHEFEKTLPPWPWAWKKSKKKLF